MRVSSSFPQLSFPAVQGVNMHVHEMWQGYEKENHLLIPAGDKVPILSRCLGFFSRIYDVLPNSYKAK